MGLCALLRLTSAQHPQELQALYTPIGTLLLQLFENLGDAHKGTEQASSAGFGGCL